MPPVASWDAWVWTAALVTVFYVVLLASLLVVSLVLYFSQNARGRR
jgi:hypothetical protein